MPMQIDCAQGCLGLVFLAAGLALLAVLLLATLVWLAGGRTHLRGRSRWHRAAAARPAQAGR